jgi:hypothetical protein
MPCSRAAANGPPNQKTLIDRAGLRGVDDILTGLSAGPARLHDALDRAAALLG